MTAEWIRKPEAPDPEKTPWENRYRDRGSVRCDCGAEVELAPAMLGPDYAARCDACGSLYNLCGQGLIPRDQWEER